MQNGRRARREEHRSFRGNGTRESAHGDGDDTGRFWVHHFHRLLSVPSGDSAQGQAPRERNHHSGHRIGLARFRNHFRVVRGWGLRVAMYNAPRMSSRMG